MDTLVLSNDYRPLCRVPWQRAMMDFIGGRVEILEKYEDRVVRTVRSVFPMPSVVRFIKAVRGVFKRRVKFNRANVWTRDRGLCQYCGRKVSKTEFTYDHVIPQARGGKTTWENIVVACVPCNQRKQDKTPEQAGMRLISKPVMPKSLPVADISKLWGDNIPQSWKDYLGTVMYWDGALDGGRS